MGQFRNPCEGKQFGPEELATMSEVFDAVWSTVAHDFKGLSTDDVAQARTVLARNIIFSASVGHTDRDVLEFIVSIAPTLPLAGISGYLSAG
jgi:hypothetical protein